MLFCFWWKLRLRRSASSGYFGAWFRALWVYYWIWKWFCKDVLISLVCVLLVLLDWCFVGGWVWKSLSLRRERSLNFASSFSFFVSCVRWFCCWMKMWIRCWVLFCFIECWNFSLCLWEVWKWFYWFWCFSKVFCCFCRTWVVGTDFVSFRLWWVCFWNGWWICV